MDCARFAATCYFVGVSVGNGAKIARASLAFTVSPGWAHARVQAVGHTPGGRLQCDQRGSPKQKCTFHPFTESIKV